MVENGDSFSIWQQELAVHSTSQGFYRKLAETAIVYVEPKGATKLMVGFDDLSRLGGTHIGRDAWGIKFALSQGWAFLGLMANRAYWFRDEQFFNFFEMLNKNGLFKKYDNVLFSGTSMGAYAALAFADLSPGANVLAFAPQNTLDQALVPWESRFAPGRQMDWSGRYREANDGIKKANKAYVIYDPMERLDRLQVGMINGDNVEKYQAFGCGHRIALIARNIYALKELTTLAMDGTLDYQSYRALFRTRGATTAYRQNLVKRLRAKGQQKRARALADTCFAMKKELDEYRENQEIIREELEQPA